MLLSAVGHGTAMLWLSWGGGNQAPMNPLSAAASPRFGFVKDKIEENVKEFERSLYTFWSTNYFGV